MSNLIAEMLKSTKEALGGDKFAGNRDIAIGSVSLESFSHGQIENVRLELDNFEDNIDKSVEDLDLFAAHSKKAALVAAGRAIAPVAGTGISRKLPNVDGLSVTVEARGISDALTPTEVSVESFDGKDPAKLAAFSYTFNAFATKQDAAGELLFPTYILGADQSALAMTVDIESIQSQVLRNDVNPDRNKFNKVSLIKAYRDSSLLNDDKNALIPVKDTKSESVLHVAQTTTIVHPDTKESIATAPILFGKRVPLLGICQTPGQLAKGIMDETDAIDPAMSLKAISAERDGEQFLFDVSTFPGSNFTYSTQGDGKDIILNLSVDGFVISLDDVKTTGKVPSPVLSALNSGMKAYYNLVIHGEANGTDGDVQAFSSAFELTSLKDANGIEVDITADPGLTAKAELDKFVLKGYVLGAFATNSNLRKTGDLLTVATMTHLYSVPFRSPITVLAPVNEGGHVSNDSKFLRTMINKAGLRTSLGAIDAIDAHAAGLKEHLSNGLLISELPSNSVSKYAVDPFYENTNIDLATKVDSQNSTERIGDVKAAITNQVKDTVQRMASTTGYTVAHKFANPGIAVKIGVAIVCGEDIEGYLDTDMDLGDKFEVRVASTPNKKMIGKFYVTFVDLSASRNEEPSALAYGINAWSPEIVAEVTRSSNGAPVRALTVTPIFKHIVLLDILAEFSLTNIQTVLGKVSAIRV